MMKPANPYQSPLTESDAMAIRIERIRVLLRCLLLSLPVTILLSGHSLWEMFTDIEAARPFHFTEFCLSMLGVVVGVAGSALGRAHLASLTQQTKRS